MGISTTEETQTSKSGTANGTTIKVGNIEWTAPKDFSYYFVSTPDLNDDTVITVDGNQTTDTTGQATGFSGGGHSFAASQTRDISANVENPPDGQTGATTEEETQ